MTNEEAKQQAIKNAYGEYWDKVKSQVDENGFIDIFKLPPILFDTAINEGSSKWRPKSIQGIDNNNGWIKIESENDLPKEKCKIWVRSLEFKEIVIINFTNSFFTPIHQTCTHWQPIITPKPPIY